MAAGVLQRQIERIVIGVAHVLEPRVGADSVWESRQISRTIHDGAVGPRVDQILAEWPAGWTRFQNNPELSGARRPAKKGNRCVQCAIAPAPESLVISFWR